MNSKLKRLTKETSVYGISMVLGRFLNFLLTPFYSNYLNKNELAFIIYVYSAIAFINIFYSFGMESAFFRFIKNDNAEFNDKDNQSIVFSNAYISILILSIINSTVLIILSYYIPNFIQSYQATPTLIQLIALIPVLDALVLIPFAYLRITRNAIKFAVLRFIAIFLNVTMNIFFLVYFSLGVWGVIFSQLISSTIALIIFLPQILKLLKFRINVSLLKQMINFGLPTLPASFSAIVLQVADRQIMEYISTPDVLANYGVNYRLAIPMMVFVSIFEYAWKPFYLNHYKDSDAKQLFAKVLTYFTFASMVLIAIWTFSLDFIVKLPFLGGKFINPAYWSGLAIVPIVMFGYYFNGVFTNLTAGFLIEKQTKYLPIAVGTGALVNIVLNLWLIPIYGIYGGAWATFIAYLLTAIIIYLFSRKVYPIRYQWHSIFIMVISTIVVIVIEHYVHTFLSSFWLVFLARSTLLLILISLLYFVSVKKQLDIALIKKILNFKK